MPTPDSFDYAVIRVVPRVERGEVINAGVVLFCLQRDFLDARVELDRNRLHALDPNADVSLIEEHLRAIPRLCSGGADAGPLGALSRKERFHWLTSPRSTMLQPSPVHSGLCEDPRSALEHLLQTMVRPL